jgi:hypothetical protein
MRHPLDHDFEPSVRRQLTELDAILEPAPAAAYA